MDLINAVKPRHEMTDAERAALDTCRTAVQSQILADQASNAKRDAKALAAERRWFASQQKEQGK